ncbi:uncharacterized protein LOC128652460 [Bombina bombina]|uniref:uncharacterized protein LOC128652460 n=1 Tax=Bombina bombina TaxID=8345 RepID=UPI00235AAC05|nr:uncharacterized protein LOC128652460 [Bombina bombina]
MQRLATDEQMILESSKSLNVLYVYDGTYEPYLIHWLFPLQIAFKQAPPTAEHSYELSMYLHILAKNIYPSWLEIFAMAERVMTTLEKEDRELFAHLQYSFQRNITFDPKDFLVELISLEREEGLKLYADPGEMERSSTFQEKLLASPVIFMRKWMGEGFVNSLDLPAVLLIWDQLFMQDWNRNVMENFCLAILMLLKDSFMDAKDYASIRQIFLHEASHLFTADIQRAWIHLQQGGLVADIHGMNRVKESRIFGELSPRLLAERDPRSFREILPISINDTVLKLFLPVRNKDRSSNAWIEQFDPLAVKLTVSVFYGPVKLRSKTNSLKPRLLEKAKENEANKNEVIVFTLQFNDHVENTSILLKHTSTEDSSQKIAKHVAKEGDWREKGKEDKLLHETYPQTQPEERDSAKISPNNPHSRKTAPSDFNSQAVPSWSKNPGMADKSLHFTGQSDEKVLDHLDPIPQSDERGNLSKYISQFLQSPERPKLLNTCLVKTYGVKPSCGSIWLDNLDRYIAAYCTAMQESQPLNPSTAVPITRPANNSKPLSLNEADGANFCILRTPGTPQAHQELCNIKKGHKRHSPIKDTYCSHSDGRFPATGEG